MKKKKVWMITVVLVVLMVLFVVFLNNRTLEDILNSDHYYTNPNINFNPEILESITLYELDEVKENGKINLEEEHTFEIEYGSEFSYKYLEDKGEYLILKIVLNHNYSADTDKFIVPSEIINQNGNLKYAKPFQFKVYDSKKENALIEITEVAFGEYEILIDKDKAFNSQRLDLFLENYQLLMVN
ncbi:hypothetical protein ACJ2A9_09745 [Anaerobacillus sp. MEB173]|uniref:hypothetical protein n=1 Tax=Anaerobacillus sp. MEB173 TaxID=3383345 RepID=UPI003F912C0C